MKTIIKPIDVIVRCTKEGLIHPLRFRIENNNDEDSHVYNVKVNFVDLDKQSKDNLIYKFNCSYLDSEKKVNAELWYKQQEHIWILYKIF